MRCVALALRLPDDAPIARRFPAIFGVLDFVGVSAGLLMAGRILVGESTAALREAWTIVFGGSMLLFVVLFITRYLAATGPRRDILRVLMRATAVPYALIGLGVLASMLSPRSTAAAFFALPALALAPAGHGRCFRQKQPVGQPRSPLSRGDPRSFRRPGMRRGGGRRSGLRGFLGCCRFARRSLPRLPALLRPGLSFTSVLRAVERSFFPAVAGYKPSIEQLSEDLESVSSEGEVLTAVEGTVRRWLECDRVEFVPCDEQVGEAQASVVDGHDEELSIPARFGGRTLALLRVGGKRGGALFTTEDVDLLGTIANHAALALAYARSYSELEKRRRQQAAAWQVERLALVETLAAEIAHEVRYPINFFRSIFQRAPDGATLAVDEIEVGCEEVERLERLDLRSPTPCRLPRRAASHCPG